MFAVKLTCLMVISQGCVLGTCSHRIDARATLYCRGPGNRVASDPQCGFRMTEVYVDGSSVAKVPVELGRRFWARGRSCHRLPGPQVANCSAIAIT